MQTGRTGESTQGLLSPKEKSWTDLVVNQLKNVSTTYTLEERTRFKTREQLTKEKVDIVYQAVLIAVLNMLDIDAIGKQDADSLRHLCELYLGTISREGQPLPYEIPGSTEEDCVTSLAMHISSLITTLQPVKELFSQGRITLATRYEAEDRIHRSTQPGPFILRVSLADPTNLIITYSNCREFSIYIKPRFLMGLMQSPGYIERLRDYIQNYIETNREAIQKTAEDSMPNSRQITAIIENEKREASRITTWISTIENPSIAVAQPATTEDKRIVQDEKSKLRGAHYARRRPISPNDSTTSTKRARSESNPL